MKIVVIADFVDIACKSLFGISWPVKNCLVYIRTPFLFIGITAGILWKVYEYSHCPGIKNVQNLKLEAHGKSMIKSIHYIK